MGNIYSEKRADFTKKAHQCAVDKLYPKIFIGSDYSIESVVYERSNPDSRMEAFDCLLGIDSIIHIRGSKTKLNEPMIITVQERFRGTDAQRWNDITITAGNNRTGIPGESSKLAAHMFLYGYYDDDNNAFTDAIAVNVFRLVVAFNKNHIDGSLNRGNDLEQPFISFKFNDLNRIKAVEWHMAQEEEWTAKDMLKAIHCRLDDQDDYLKEKLNIQELKIDRLLNMIEIKSRIKKDNNGSETQPKLQLVHSENR